MEAATENLVKHLQQHPDLNFADVAYTLQVGRRSFAHRRMVVGRDLEDAIERLKSQDSQSFLEDSKTPAIAFMFPGQGTQYVGMGKELYQAEPVFKEQVDRCCELLKPHLGLDLRSLIYPDSSETKSGFESLNTALTPPAAPLSQAWERGRSEGKRGSEAPERLKATAIAQPALFVIEYALAQLWMSWGITPQAAIGHSIGEYVAATLAGVFSLEDALGLVATRGRLMQQLPSGGMLSVTLSEEEVRDLLTPNSELSIAAINGPKSCVVSGTEEAIALLQNELQSQGISCRRLHTSHAFHSPMMDGILAAFREEAKKFKLHPPSIPFISNVTGNWITAAQATDPNYWAQHLRQTVRFSAGIDRLLEDPNRILLEVGAGNTLCTLANKKLSGVALPSLRHPQQHESDVAFLLNTLGKLWLSGVKIDWFAFYAHQRRDRLSLPTYPFERQRYWIEQKTQHNGRGAMHCAPTAGTITQEKSDIADRFYVPSWKLAPLSPLASPVSLGPYLIFVDECGLGERLLAKLKVRGEEAIAVRIGSNFAKLSRDSYTINPLAADDYKALVNTLIAQQLQPKAIAHFWNVTKSQSPSPLDTHCSLLFLAQALGKLTDELQMAVISNNLQEVTGEELLDAQKATLLGLVKVIPQEYPNIKCRSIDLVLAQAGSRGEEKAIERLLQELQATSPPTPLLQGEGSKTPPSLQGKGGLGFDSVIAYRGNHRWVQHFEPARLEGVETLHCNVSTSIPSLRAGGVYLITGGLGGIGLVLAAYLAQQVQAKLVLIGRSWFPERAEWQEWLENNAPQDAISRKIHKIKEIESFGAEVIVIQADVANLQEMQQAVTQIQGHFDRIDGIIHAAGVPGGGAIQRQTAKMAESILAPKVRGTLVLKQIFQDVELDFLVLCSSLTAIEGGFGQADYASANAFLDAFARQETNSNGNFTVSIDWDTWQEVGMAVEALEDAASTQKVSIIAPGDPPKSPLKRGTSVSLSHDRVSEALHPLFDECVALDSETEVYISRFSVNKHWVLKEHRVMGKAMLPATAYLEMARSAVSKYAENRAIEVRNIYFLTPLVVKDGEEKEVQTRLTKRGNSFEFVISSQDEERSWQEHAKGDLVLMELESPKEHDILEIEQSCQQAIADRQPASEYIEFGARWRNIRQLRFGDRQGLALLKLPPEFASDMNLYQLHPALLDVATGFLSAEISGTYLPFFCNKLKIKGALPKRIYSYVRCRETNLERSETLQFDISIMNESGRELVEIEGYTLKKLRELDSRNVPEILPSPRPNGHPSPKLGRGDGGEGNPPIRREISENFGLEIANPGILDSLKWRSHPRQKPGAGEVEIEVRAVGLNFKEVLIALGMLPIPPDLHFQFGLECAGEIVAIGDEVEGWAVGDEVIAFANGCLSRYVTTGASLIASKPKHLSWEEAATIPIAFTTAYYSLVELGRLQPGESILIHAAAGGVGLAAVQIAQQVGAEIWATAGSSEKREFLHSLGIDRLMDSRTLDFADEVRQRTNGRGVDVVLNSLAGEFLTESLKVVAPYGRFLEIGKRDILSHSQLDLGLLAKGLSFFAINLEPELPCFSKVWGEVVQHFHSQDFSPLPCRVFPVTEMGNALEYMARAKHIGKVVVSLQDREAWKEIDRKLIVGGDTSNPPACGTPLNKGGRGDGHRFIQEGLSPQEGVTAFSRILASGLSQVLVSKRDLSDLGKQDTSLSLPATVSATKPQPENGYLPPQNEIEGTISAIWQEMLGRERVGIRDNFFDLGGDSLLLVQVRSKLHAALNCDISTADLFEYPTIAALAAYLSQKQAGETAFDPIRERAKRQQEAEMELMQHSRGTI